MKKSGFRKPSYEEYRAKQALKASKPRKPLKKAKTSLKTPSTEVWLKKIPLGSHGTGIYQKKLWKTVSDYVRISDWYDFNGKCISCGKYLAHWKLGHAAHYRPFSRCTGYDKFNKINIMLSCAYCNSVGGRINNDTNSVGHNFAMNIVIRYGLERLEFLEQFTNKPPQKLETPVVIGLIKEHIKLMEKLPEKPDYWYTVKDLC